MLTLNNTVGIGRMISIINTQDIAIIGILANFGYFTLLIIRIATIALSNNAKYGLYRPLKYNVATINDIMEWEINKATCFNMIGYYIISG